MNTETPAAPPTPDVTGIRVFAAVIDIIVLIAIGVVFSLLFGESDSSASSEEGASFNLSLSGLPFVIYLLVTFAYYAVFEATTGRTFGKMMVGIKVVSANGAPLSPMQVAVRTLLRFVDGLPFLYLVGFIAMVSTKRKQRIGDMAAGTIVIKG